MKTFDDLISKLYEDRLLTVEKKYSDPGLRERFENYMRTHYERFAVRTVSLNPKLLPIMLADWYDSEVRDWGNYTDEGKYSNFTPDENLIQAENLSRKVFAFAIDRAKGNVQDPSIIEENKKRIALIRGYVNNVREENQKDASWVLSEALVDANYASGASEFISFRLREWLHSHGYFEH